MLDPVREGRQVQAVRGRRGARSRREVALELRPHQGPHDLRRREQGPEARASGATSCTWPRCSSPTPRSPSSSTATRRRRRWSARRSTPMQRRAATGLPRRTCRSRASATSLPAGKGYTLHADQLHAPLDDLEVAPQFPVGHRIEPLAPFPFAGGGEVLDEVVAEPVARDLRVAEDARRLDERARRARDVLGALVGAGDGLRA